MSGSGEVPRMQVQRQQVCGGELITFPLLDLITNLTSPVLRLHLTASKVLNNRFRSV